MSSLTSYDLTPHPARPDASPLQVGQEQTPSSGDLLNPSEICWRCLDGTSQRMQRAYAAVYQHGQGRSVTVVSCRTLGQIVKTGPSRASDVLWGLEALGLAEVEPGCPGRGEEVESTKFRLVRPAALLACKAGRHPGLLSKVSTPQIEVSAAQTEGSTTTGGVGHLKETLGLVPSPIARPDWARADDDPSHERWRYGDYGDNGWAMAAASARLGHPWLTARALARAVGIHESTAGRILTRMQANGDAEHHAAHGWRLNLRFPITVLQYDEIQNDAVSHRDLVDLARLDRAEYDSDEAMRHRQDRHDARRRADRLIRSQNGARHFDQAVRRTKDDGVERARTTEEHRVARRALMDRLATHDSPSPEEYQAVADEGVRLAAMSSARVAPR